MTGKKMQFTNRQSVVRAKLPAQHQDGRHGDNGRKNEEKIYAGEMEEMM